jgi:ketosteroid isomerase-like protein
MAARSPQDCDAAFAAALIARDMDAALALLTVDVVFFYSNGTTLAGKDAFAATMRANWSRVTDYKYETHDVLWLMRSDSAAAVIYGFRWSGVAGGNAVSGSGRATRLLRRESDGWRVAHEHLSQGTWSLNAG